MSALVKIHRKPKVKVSTSFGMTYSGIETGSFSCSAVNARTSICGLSCRHTQSSSDVNGL